MIALREKLNLGLRLTVLFAFVVGLALANALLFEAATERSVSLPEMVRAATDEARRQNQTESQIPEDRQGLSDLTPAPGDDVLTSEDEGVSPFEIKRRVDQNRRAASLGKREELDLQPYWKRLKIDSGAPDRCDGCYEAKLFSLELDGQRGLEVLLKLTRAPEFCRYLAFKRARKSSGQRPLWKFLGHVDHDFNKYEWSRHRVLKADGQNWLVIRGQEGSGSGFALYGETWYEASEKGLRPVLHYPAEGHTYPWPSGLSRQFKAQIIVPPRPAGQAKTLTIEYEVTYSALDYIRDAPRSISFSNRHHARYVWNETLREFVFDADESNISEREIGTIANIEPEEEEASVQIGQTNFYSDKKSFVGGGYEVFLKYNLARLMRIATGRDLARKEWLRQFLKECDETPEKQALESALEK